MRLAAAGLGVAAAALLLAGPAPAQAVFFFNYTAATCSGFVPSANYTVISTMNQDLTEGVLANAKHVLPLVPEDCFPSLMRLVCLNAYPQFNYNTTAPGKQPVCIDVCLSALKTCLTFVQQLQNPAITSKIPGAVVKFLPVLLNLNCSDTTAYAPASCSAPAPNFTILSQMKQADCPAPLVVNPYANHTTVASEPGQTCVGRCCATCPITFNLYAVGTMSAHRKGEYALHVISFVTAFFVMVSYMVLPGKRKIPAAFILNLSICLVIFHASSFFGVGDMDKVVCRNSITAATQVDTPICGAQAFFLIYGILSTASWFYFLVLNLHMNIVWRSKALKHGFYIIHALCWIVPLILTIAPTAAQGIIYEYGNFCLANQTWRNAVLFYPLAVYIFAAFLLNLMTSAKIFQISRATNLEMKDVIALQLRPFIYSLGYLFIFLFFWIYDFTSAANLARDATDMFATWFSCIVFDGLSQDQCYERNKGSLPSLGLRITADDLVGIVGLWTFIFFGAKKQIFVEWYQFLTGTADDEEDMYTSTTSQTTVEMTKPTFHRGSTSTALVGNEATAGRV